MNHQNPGANNGVAIGVTTRLKVKSGETNSAIPLLTTLVIASTKFKGQLTAEITPPTPLHDEWIIVQRFSTEAEAIAWRDSDTRKATLEKLAPYVMERGIADDTSQHQCDGSVAASISSVIKPGLEEDYFAWLNDIQTAQALSPGYQGTYLQMQKTHESSFWTTMLRFNTQEALEEWMASKRRTRTGRAIQEVYFLGKHQAHDIVISRLAACRRKRRVAGELEGRSPGFAWTFSDRLPADSLSFSCSCQS